MCNPPFCYKYETRNVEIHGEFVGPLAPDRDREKSQDFIKDFIARRYTGRLYDCDKDCNCVFIPGMETEWKRSPTIAGAVGELDLGKILDGGLKYVYTVDLEHRMYFGVCYPLGCKIDWSTAGQVGVVDKLPDSR